MRPSTPHALRSSLAGEAVVIKICETDGMHVCTWPGNASHQDGRAPDDSLPARGLGTGGTEVRREFQAELCMAQPAMGQFKTGWRADKAHER